MGHKLICSLKKIYDIEILMRVYEDEPLQKLLHECFGATSSNNDDRFSRELNYVSGNKIVAKRSTKCIQKVFDHQFVRNWENQRK